MVALIAIMGMQHSKNAKCHWQIQGQSTMVSTDHEPIAVGGPSPLKLNALLYLHCPRIWPVYPKILFFFAKQNFVRPLVVMAPWALPTLGQQVSVSPTQGTYFLTQALPPRGKHVERLLVGYVNTCIPRNEESYTGMKNH